MGDVLGGSIGDWMGSSMRLVLSYQEESWSTRTPPHPLPPPPPSPPPFPASSSPPHSSRMLYTQSGAFRLEHREAEYVREVDRLWEDGEAEALVAQGRGSPPQWELECLHESCRMRNVPDVEHVRSPLFLCFSLSLSLSLSRSLARLLARSLSLSLSLSLVRSLALSFARSLARSLSLLLSFLATLLDIR